MTIYGYARISSASRRKPLYQQIERLKQWGIPEENIYYDMAPGFNFDRPQYQELKSKLQPGDIIYITKFDRFSRADIPIFNNEFQFYLYNRIQLITISAADNRIIQITMSQRLPLLEAYSRLTLFAFAEGVSIKERTYNGREFGRLQGQEPGRPPKKLPPNAEIIFREQLAGNITIAQACKELQISKSTYIRKRRRFLNKNK